MLTAATVQTEGTRLSWFSQFLLGSSFARDRLRTLPRTLLLWTAPDSASLAAVLWCIRLLAARVLCRENNICKVDNLLLGVSVDLTSHTICIDLVIGLSMVPKFDQVRISQLSAIEEMLDFDFGSLGFRLLCLSRGIRSLEPGRDSVQWSYRGWCFIWPASTNEGPSELGAVVANRWRGLMECGNAT